MIIMSDAVKSGIVEMLKPLGYKMYKETMTNPTYPHFFIDQINLSIQKRGKLFFLTYLMGVQYRHLKDPTKDGTINSNLDFVGLELIERLNYINVSGAKIYAQNSSYEKVDGVLQFTCNFVVKATREEVEQIKMETAEIVS